MLLTHIAMSHELQRGTKRTAVHELPLAQQIRSFGQRCSPRQSLQCRRQVSCPFPGEKYGTPRDPNLLSTPQVRASDLFDLTLNELSGVAAQAPDPVLQHVRRQTDGIHG